MSMGVSARELSDDDLRHELAQLKKKAEDIATDGTSEQQKNHHARTDELEAEFLRRFLPESEGTTEASSDAPESADASSDAPEPSDTSSDEPEPADAPTDEPDRPANPA